MRKIRKDTLQQALLTAILIYKDLLTEDSDYKTEYKHKSHLLDLESILLDARDLPWDYINE